MGCHRELHLQPWPRAGLGMRTLLGGCWLSSWSHCLACPGGCQDQQLGALGTACMQVSGPGAAGHRPRAAVPYPEGLTRRRATRLPTALIPVSAGESSTVVSPYLPGGVSDGQWHTLQLRYYNKVLSPAVPLCVWVCLPVGPPASSSPAPTSGTACCPLPEVSLVAHLCPARWCRGHPPFPCCSVSRGVSGSGGP